MRGDESVFPIPGHNFLDVNRKTKVVEPSGGLTRRDLFALVALHGMLVNPESGSLSDTTVACMAVQDADALIAELAKVQG